MNTSLENPCSFRIAKERLPRIAAAMGADRRLAELVEAVRWERECEANINAFATLHTTHARLYDNSPLSKIIDARRADIKMLSRCARAAVDALVGGEAKNAPATRPSLAHAFLQGAKFWEFHQTGGTMWQSDQRLCALRAKEMESDGTIGVDALVGEG